MNLNIKMNVRKYLKENTNRSNKNISKYINLNNTIKQEKNYSKNNINKKSNYIKIVKMFSNNGRSCKMNYNNSSSNNNIFIDLNEYRKTKSYEKNNNYNKNELDVYKENKIENNNRKIMIKQIPYDIKKYLNNQKFPQYDTASFRKAIKYYTLKSDSKTIQEKDLSSYFRPIRNILRVKNIQKIKEKQNKNSSSSNILFNSKIYGNSIKINNIIENKNRNINYKSDSHLTKNIYIDLMEIEKQDINLMDTFNNINNNINNSYLQNLYFNKNSIQTERTNKNIKFPFNIKVNQKDKAIKIINKNNKNISETISFNNNNSKNISDYDTQISINNNANNANNNWKIEETNSKTLYQFRPRKIHLPKTGISLSSMHYKNKILQNILNKRKETNKRKI